MPLITFRAPSLSQITRAIRLNNAGDDLQHHSFGPIHPVFAAKGKPIATIT
jgi:hypothetical protein